MISSQQRLLFIVLLFTAIVRAAMLWSGWDNLREDPDAYTAMSQTLTRSGVFGLTTADGTPLPTAFRPPLYPAVLSGLTLAIITVSGIFADPLATENLTAFRLLIAALHWGLGLLTVAATYGAARRLLGHVAAWPSVDVIHRPAAVAALLVAIDPILLQSSTRVMTETLATTLAAMSLWAWTLLMEQLQRDETGEPSAARPKNRSDLVTTLVLAFVLGLAYLCRPTFIVWTAMLAGYLVLWAVLARRLKPLSAAIAIVLVTTVLVGGWMLRNQRHFGQPIWATTHGGYTLLLGNNPPFYQYVREGSLGVAWDPQFFFERWEARTLADPRVPSFWEPEMPVEADPDWLTTQPAAADEIAQDRLAYETAKMTIRNDPSGFIQACLFRLARLWSPLPLRHGGPIGLAIVAVTVFYTLILLSAVVGAVMLRRQLFLPFWAAALCLLLALGAVHAVYWTDMRMRSPAVPVLAILAVVPLTKRPVRLTRSAAGRSVTEPKVRTVAGA